MQRNANKSNSDQEMRIKNDQENSQQLSVLSFLNIKILQNEKTPGKIIIPKNLKKLVPMGHPKKDTDSNAESHGFRRQQQWKPPRSSRSLASSAERSNDSMLLEKTLDVIFGNSYITVFPKVLPKALSSQHLCMFLC